MSGPELLQAYLTRMAETPRDFCRRSNERLGEPGLSRYLSGKTIPTIAKGKVIAELTGGKVPLESWVPDEKPTANSRSSSKISKTA